MNQINKKLLIDGSHITSVVFIYTIPKVGSTTLVSSLRLYLPDNYKVVHVHDEEMIGVLYGIRSVTINAIINYNRDIGRNIYVIDVYRLPIELKISTFFEKLQTVHFNKISLHEMSNLPIQAVINIFHKIFPYIGTGDNYTDAYNIIIPSVFNHNVGYEMINQNNIKYVKLLLHKSSQWSEILSRLFATDIKLINDYETANKPVNKLYARFKTNYEIPRNLLAQIASCKYLNYFLTPPELTKYIQLWRVTEPIFRSFSADEYRTYLKSKNSKKINTIDFCHYFDNGCTCEQCSTMRETVKKTGISKNIVHYPEITQGFVSPMGGLSNVVRGKNIIHAQSGM